MVNVDTVYQRVLAFANKEQRGYITPQEFNLFANQAQMEIFEQYFYDINQFGRLHGNDTEYSDMINLLNEKLSIFEVRLINQGFTLGIFDLQNLDPVLYKLGTVIFDGIEVEGVNNDEYHYMQSSPLTRPTMSRPVYVKRVDGLNVYPQNIGIVDVSYIKRPDNVSWGYVVVNGKAMYDPDTNKTTNFELHQSEETGLVYKILKYAGITMQKDDIMRAGQGLDMAQVQQEKQ